MIFDKTNIASIKKSPLVKIGFLFFIFGIALHWICWCLWFSTYIISPILYFITGIIGCFFLPRPKYFAVVILGLPGFLLLSFIILSQIIETGYGFNLDEVFFKMLLPILIAIFAGGYLGNIFSKYKRKS